MTQNLFEANEPAASSTSEAPKDRPTATTKYIPVYHVELVRDRRVKIETRSSVHNSDDVVALLEDELLNADREKLICVMLNAKNGVIGMDIVSVGSLTASIAHPREIFKPAILKNAASIILSHNLCGTPHNAEHF